MEYCQGRIFWDAALPELDRNSERALIYEEMNRVLAELHRVDFETNGLSDYGKPGNYFARQLSRWTSQYRASELGHIPAMETLMHWLNEEQPEDDGRKVIPDGFFTEIPYSF